MNQSGSRRSQQGGGRSPRNTPIVLVESESTTDQLLPYTPGGIDR